MILLTGASGMLGNAVQNELRNNNIDYLSLDIKGENDYTGSISDKKLLSTIFKDNQIECIINCAAWTDVDGAEELSNKEKVDECNVIGVENLCNFSKQYNSKLVHISTDYVFNGSGTKPWNEKDIPTIPINYYGYTKLQSEKLVERLRKFFIVRIQWTYGKNGKNFVDTMLKLAESHKEIRVVNDQVGSPTCVDDLAKTLIEISLSDKYGYYHIASSGDYVSWYDFCKEIYKQSGKDIKVIPVTSEQYGSAKAKRPKNSRLDRTKYVKCGFTMLPDWKQSLKCYLMSIINK